MLRLSPFLPVLALPVCLRSTRHNSPYGTLLRLKSYALSSCVGQHAVFPAPLRLLLVSDDSGAISGRAAQRDAEVRVVHYF